MKINFKLLGLFFALNALNLVSKDIDINLLIPNKENIDVLAAKEVVSQLGAFSVQNKAELLKELDSLKSDLNKRWYRNLAITTVAAIPSAWSSNKLYKIYSSIYRFPELTAEAQKLGLNNPTPEKQNRFGVWPDSFMYDFSRNVGLFGEGDTKKEDNIRSFFKKLKCFDNVQTEERRYLIEEKLGDEPDPLHRGDGSRTVFSVRFMNNPLSGPGIFPHLVPAVLLVLSIVFKDKIKNETKFLVKDCKEQLGKINQIRELINSTKTV